MHHGTVATVARTPRDLYLVTCTNLFSNLLQFGVVLMDFCSPLDYIYLIVPADYPYIEVSIAIIFHFFVEIREYCNTFIVNILTVCGR